MCARRRTVSAKSPPKLNWLLIVSIFSIFRRSLSLCAVVYRRGQQSEYIPSIDPMFDSTNKTVQSSFELHFQHVIALASTVINKTSTLISPAPSVASANGCDWRFYHVMLVLFLILCQRECWQQSCHGNVVLTPPIQLKTSPLLFTSLFRNYNLR